MTDIKQIRDRLESIEANISQRKYNLKSLETKLEGVRDQIHEAVEGANKQQREELDNLLMHINLVKTKFGRRLS